MPGGTLSTLDNVLKEHYVGPIRRQVNDSMVITREVKRNPAVMTGGQQVTIPVGYGGTGGTGARAEGGTLPSATNQSFEQIVLNMAYNYGRMQISGPAIKASRSNTFAFTKGLRAEMDGLVRDIKKSVNRQWYNPSTGAIADAVSGHASTGVLTLESTHESGERIANMNRFWEGMVIDIVTDAAGADVYADQTISVIDRSARTVTCSTSNISNTADTDYVVIADTANGTGTYEILGLMAWVGSTTNTIGTIDRSDGNDEWFRPNVLDNSGSLRALSLDLMRQSVDEADERSGGQIDMAITSHAVRRKYEALVRADRRHVNTMKLDGGSKGLEYDGFPIIVDSHCDLNLIYFLEKGDLGIYEMGDFDWMDEDGAILNRVANTDAYEGTMTWYSQFCVHTPPKHTMLDDITT